MPASLHNSVVRMFLCQHLPYAARLNIEGLTVVYRDFADS